MRSTVQTIDYIVLVAYLCLMAGVGAYFMRFMRAGTDFLKGGNRIEWWVAGMASFMSGFSVWTFTGGAGFAYQHGIIGTFLLSLAVPAFLLGYLVYATRWRRSRVSTVVEYIRERFGVGTHKTFSWMTGPSQLMFASVRLFALSSFMSIALGIPVPYLIVVCGIVILLYTVLGGYWAVCFTDMFQFMFLLPVACVLMVLSLADVGGVSGFVAKAPEGFFNPFAGEYGWLFLLAYTVSQITGYNNFANAQRYFCAPTERDARKIALLCMALFTVGTLVFYTPLFILESIFQIPLGLPLLYGFLVRRGPWWSALFAYVVGAATSLFVNVYLNNYLGWGLNETYLIGIPAITTTAAFFTPVLLYEPEGEFAARVAGFFKKLHTPIDPAKELSGRGVSGRGQLAIVGRVTTGIGLACFLMLLAADAGRNRTIITIYAAATTIVGLLFVLAGRTAPASAREA